VNFIAIMDNKVHLLPLNGLEITKQYPKKFGYAWDTQAVPQEYQYLKSIWYGYGSIFEVPIIHSLSIKLTVPECAKFDKDKLSQVPLDGS
jgi:hypothetical protein